MSLREANAAVLLAERGMAIAEIARRIGRGERTVARVIREAREILELNAAFYAEQHAVAAAVAALKGDGRPSQWALEKVRAVEPSASAGDGGVRVQIGVVIPGLGSSADAARLALLAGESVEAEVVQQDTDDSNG